MANIDTMRKKQQPMPDAHGNVGYARKEDGLNLDTKKPNKGKSPAQRDRQLEQRGRLPDRATFIAHYNAARKVWIGRLDICLGNDTATGESIWQSFEGECSGITKLPTLLDDQYRSWLREQEAGK